MESSNPSQLKARTLSALFKHSRNAAIKCNIPILLFTGDLRSGKITCFGDSATVKNIENHEKFFKDLKSVISLKKQNGLNFVEKTEEKYCPLYFLPSNILSESYTCHDIDHIFRNLFKALGFSKNGKRFGNKDDKPKWFNETFPKWEKFTKAEIPQGSYKRNKKTIKLSIVKAAYRCYLSDEEITSYMKNEPRRNHNEFCVDNSRNVNLNTETKIEDHLNFIDEDEEIGYARINRLADDLSKEFDSFDREFESKLQKKTQNNEEMVAELQNQINLIKSEALDKEKKIKIFENMKIEFEEEKKSEVENFQKRIDSLSNEYTKIRSELVETENIQKNQIFQIDQQEEKINKTIEIYELRIKNKNKILEKYNTRLQEVRKINRNVIKLKENEHSSLLDHYKGRFDQNSKKRKQFDDFKDDYINDLESELENKQSELENKQSESGNKQRLQKTVDTLSTNVNNKKRKIHNLESQNKELKEEKQNLQSQNKEIAEEKEKCKLILNYKLTQDFVDDLEKRLSGSNYKFTEIGKTKIYFSNNSYSSLVTETICMGYNRLCNALNISVHNKKVASFNKFKKILCQLLILQELSDFFVLNRYESILKVILTLFETVAGIQFKFSFGCNENRSVLSTYHQHNNLRKSLNEITKKEKKKFAEYIHRLSLIDISCIDHIIDSIDYCKKYI